ncbi:MAG TPA: hypothetical protein EYO65_01465 [Nitrospirales bacterium]|nr:hypothetical protein [Nitrospirales bacterium]
MELSRYRVIDAYTLEELRRQYHDADTNGRIDLLKEFNEPHTLPNFPYEIACLAVEDSHLEVRQWIARHGTYLDFRDGTDDTVQGERNLIERLKNDPDPFVRACLRENPVFLRPIVGDFRKFFEEATHLERLGLLRNPALGSDTGRFIEKLFDPDDSELEIDMGQRVELILAYLTNTKAIHLYGEFIYAEFDEIWRLISRWPKEHKLDSVVYPVLPAPDDTKAEIYKNCKESVRRKFILKGCEKKDVKTLELGLDDSDESTREIAEERLRRLSWEEEPPLEKRIQDLQRELHIVAERTRVIDNWVWIVFVLLVLILIFSVF